MRVARSPDHGGQDGNAIVEFVVLTALFLIPLTYLVLAVFQVQGAAYGVTEAAREAGRAFVQADSLDTAYPQSCTAAALALHDQGAVVSGADCSGQLVISCVADQPCAVRLTPGATIRARVKTSVQLPFLPSSVFGVSLTVRVSATHDEIVDQFRAAG